MYQLITSFKLAIKMQFRPLEGWLGGMHSFNWIEQIQDLHVICFGRYWSHIQDFQDLIRRISRICRHTSFPTFPTSDFLIYNNMFLNILWEFLDYFEYCAGSEAMNEGLWGSRTFPIVPKIMNMKTFGIFRKWKVKHIIPHWSRIFLWNFWPSNSWNL